MRSLQLDHQHAQVSAYQQGQADTQGQLEELLERMRRMQDGAAGEQERLRRQLVEAVAQAEASKQQLQQLQGAAAEEVREKVQARLGQALQQQQVSGGG